MPKIAPQHAWKDAEHIPSQEWSDDTIVQWGSRGVVLGKNSYRTAFFEAFPPKSEDCGGFIRGEGETISAAEEDALRKYRASHACTHLWGRERYTNGGQLCRHCRAFRSSVLKPITRLGDWRRPLGSTGMSIIDMGLENAALPDDSPWKTERETDRYTRRICLQYILFGAEKCTLDEAGRRARVAPLLT